MFTIYCTENNLTGLFQLPAIKYLEREKKKICQCLKIKLDDLKEISVRAKSLKKTLESQPEMSNTEKKAITDQIQKKEEERTQKRNQLDELINNHRNIDLLITRVKKDPTFIQKIYFILFTIFFALIQTYRQQELDQKLRALEDILRPYFNQKKIKTILQEIQDIIFNSPNNMPNIVNVALIYPNFTQQELFLPEILNQRQQYRFNETLTLHQKKQIKLAEANQQINSYKKTLQSFQAQIIQPQINMQKQEKSSFKQFKKYVKKEKRISSEEQQEQISKFYEQQKEEKEAIQRQNQQAKESVNQAIQEIKANLNKEIQQAEIECQKRQQEKRQELIVKKQKLEQKRQQEKRQQEKRQQEKRQQEKRQQGKRQQEKQQQPHIRKKTNFQEMNIQGKITQQQQKDYLKQLIKEKEMENQQPETQQQKQDNSQYIINNIMLQVTSPPSKVNQKQTVVQQTYEINNIKHKVNIIFCHNNDQ